MLLIVTIHLVPNCEELIGGVTLYQQTNKTTHEKILTLSAIAIIFASSFANASTVTTGKVKTSKTIKTHYSKISVKGFSIKGMQDTKDILLQTTPKVSA